AHRFRTQFNIVEPVQHLNEPVALGSHRAIRDSALVSDKRDVLANRTRLPGWIESDLEGDRFVLVNSCRADNLRAVSQPLVLLNVKHQIVKVLVWSRLRHDVWR